jgi:hypothetical protein
MSTCSISLSKKEIQGGFQAFALPYYENTLEFFDLSVTSPYMLLIADVNKIEVNVDTVRDGFMGKRIM